MTDIVGRLRAWQATSDPLLGEENMREAADEIERLRAEFELFREAPSKLEVAQYEIERLRAIADTIDIMTEQAIKRQNDEIERLRAALSESVKLQSHYSSLLNDYDGGKRMQFASSEAWMERLARPNTRLGQND